MSKNTDAIKRLARLINENWPEPGKVKIQITYEARRASRKAKKEIKGLF